MCTPQDFPLKSGGGGRGGRGGGCSSRSIRRRRSSSCSNATHGTTWGRWETIVQGAAKRAKGGTGAARWQLRAVRRSSRVRNSSSRREALGAVHSLRVARRQLAHTSSLAASTTRKCLSGRSIPSRFCAADGVACRWRTGNFDCFLIDINLTSLPTSLRATLFCCSAPGSVLCVTRELVQGRRTELSGAPCDYEAVFARCVSSLVDERRCVKHVGECCCAAA